MSTSSTAEHLIAGAGVSGLYAALLLARAGRRVRLLERDARAGGLAAGETFRGLPCDLGSHRLHAAALAQPLFREMHERAPLLTRPRRGVLLLGGRRVPYPPTPLSMLRALGLRAGAAMAVGFATRRRAGAFSRWDSDRAAGLGDDIGFARFVRDRVGDAAYEAFYRPYAEKVWGIDPDELSQSVAKKRVSTTSPLALFQTVTGRAAALLDRGARGSVGPGARLDRFLYPPGGIASIVGYLEARLAELGVRAEHGRALAAPAAGQPPPGCARADGLGSRGGPPVLFAGDLADLVPDAPLEHRGLYLVYLALPVAELGPHETYYCPDPRFWFGRASELLHYAPGLRRHGETVLCVEIPEGRWGRGLDFASGARLSSLLDQLAAAGVTPRGLAPIEVRQRFIPKVYPLYRRGWLDAWRRAMRRAAEAGAIPFGRQALFLHCNLDHCAAIAADAVAHVQAGRSPAAWIAHAERYLDLQVRD